MPWGNVGERGIAEALAATAVGILVALPAVVAYNIFQKKGADVEENAMSLGALVLAVMHSHPHSGKGERSAHDAPEAERLARARA